mgnify:FL=1
MIENILNDPMFWKIATVVIILILIASFKKLFKLVLVLILILVIYAGYLIYTGEDPEDVLESFKQRGEKAKELIEEKVKQENETPAVIDGDNEKKEKKNLSKKKRKETIKNFKEFEEESLKKFKEYEEETKRKLEEMKKKIGGGN